MRASKVEAELGAEDREYKGKGEAVELGDGASDDAPPVSDSEPVTERKEEITKETYEKKLERLNEIKTKVVYEARLQDLSEKIKVGVNPLPVHVLLHDVLNDLLNHIERLNDVAGRKEKSLLAAYEMLCALEKTLLNPVDFRSEEADSPYSLYSRLQALLYQYQMDELVYLGELHKDRVNLSRILLALKDNVENLHFGSQYNTKDLNEALKSVLAYLLNGDSDIELILQRHLDMIYPGGYEAFNEIINDGAKIELAVHIYNEVKKFFNEEVYGKDINEALSLSPEPVFDEIDLKIRLYMNLDLITVAHRCYDDSVIYNEYLSRELEKLQSYLDYQGFDGAEKELVKRVKSKCEMLICQQLDDKITAHCDRLTQELAKHRQDKKKQKIVSAQLSALTETHRQLSEMRDRDELSFLDYVATMRECNALCEAAPQQQHLVGQRVQPSEAFEHTHAALTKRANTLKGSPSRGKRILGGLLIALATTMIGFGVFASLTVIGVVIGAPVAGGGAFLLATGIAFFAHGKRKGLSKDLETFANKTRERAIMNR